MDIDIIIQQLKKCSKSVNYYDRCVLKNHEVKKNGYNYGAMLNKYNGQYEVYSYVINDDTQSIANLLLYELFDNINKAKEYFEKLSYLLDDKDIMFLLNECRSK